MRLDITYLEKAAQISLLETERTGCIRIQVNIDENPPTKWHKAACAASRCSLFILFELYSTKELINITVRI